MSATGDYVDALNDRIADLEFENEKLRNTIAEMKERLMELAK